MRTDDAVDQQNAYQESHDNQQPLLIEPPSDDLFHFESLPSDNSSLTNVTELTFRSPSPPIFAEHSLLVTFDPLDVPQPHENNNETLLDPFEELMRMKEANQDDNKDTDMYHIDDVIIDVGDDVITKGNNDEIDVINDPQYDVDDIDGDVTNSRSTSSKYHVTDGSRGDVVDSLEQVVPVPYNERETMRNLGHDRNKEPSDHVTYRDGGDVINPPEQVEPVPRPRKIKDKMKPALWPRGSKKEKSESDEKKEKPDVKPYSVMIMVDDEIVKTPSDRNLNPAPARGEMKQQRLARLAQEEEQEVYKTPSQIRREMEQASKESQQQIPQSTKRTQKEFKQKPDKEDKQRPGKKQKQKPEKEQKLKPEKDPKLNPGASGNSSTQYHIEEKRKKNSSDQGQTGEQEEEMGKGRLKKLIAAFNK